ncbi:MAG: Crp/Fnr family transcriptional regulator [Rhodobacteraceae bacterium]|nr:Crp/Fnr family transcriptional regulator [Paracoccaceae bacterium]
MTDESLSEKISLLEQSTLFAGLNGPTLSSLVAHAHLRKYMAGDLIFRDGSQGESMMVITQGVVRISAMTPTARDVILTELTQGDVFGELALLDGGTRSADAHAQTNCMLLILERRALLQVMKTAPNLAIRLLELLCARLRRSDERMMEFAFLKLPSRLARTMLRVSSSGEGAGARPTKGLSHSQSEIADMVGSSRENVNRCLHKWQRDGLLDLTKGWIILLNRDGLKRIAEAD